MHILSVELLTDDIAGTAEFYTGVLGLPLHMADEDTLDIGAGSSRLLFRRSDNMQPVYHFAFNIPCNQIEEAVAFMDKKVPLLRHGDQTIIDFSAWNASAIYFEDNNGNILEFIARRDLNNSKNEAFTASSLECVSEIAVVTSNVSAFCENIKQETGLTFYEKQTPHKNFAAMGDAEGLLIVSEASRHWFPTEKEARPFPAKLSISEKGRFYPLEFTPDQSKIL